MNAVHDNRADTPVALVTGAARRIGRSIAETLHAGGYTVIAHCRSSHDEAQSLVDTLNKRRADSAVRLDADLGDPTALSDLAAQALAVRGHIDLLINNASGFYPTPLGELSDAAWHELLGSNLRGPLWLSSALRTTLTERRGAIVNIIDVNARLGLADYPIYCAAKSGLESVTRSLALALGPAVRVNAVAPGAILWPEHDVPDADAQRRMLAKTALGRIGDAGDIAAAVAFLCGRDAAYMTGQTLCVDGGRQLYGP